MSPSRPIQNSVSQIPRIDLLPSPIIKPVKAYIRKSNILFSMREYTKSLEAIQEARDVDEEHKHSSEIQQQEIKVQQAIFSQRGEETQEQTLERAMRDPEVAVGTPSSPRTSNLT